MKPTLSRKEIASMTGLCEKTIKAKEKHFGLDSARINTGSRSVLYSRTLALSALKVRNLAV